jgi:hypothetical protein
MMSKTIGNFIPILKNGLTSISINNIPELALIVDASKSVIPSLEG